MNDLLIYKDKSRSCGGKLPLWKFFFRKLNSRFTQLRLVYKFLFKISSFLYHVEISPCTQIGEGLYVGHPFGITINPNVVIGKNCNLSKGVTIGQENRGKRKGTPVIGNSVYCGVNSTIVGAITIGDDVLIAPNSYVNCNVPSHSIVIGNPCTIIPRENATEGYINNKV